ncbi:MULTISPECIES: transposase [Bacillaceae]|uniref:Transposase n=1 Tax=Evansella alkalicola TaxID=745819 RepID=A0ABS6JUU0_9BACI|nr:MULTISPECIES: transposase [Bacillaceae]MBU9722268.1 transposase [Bacillus alkalicola]
MPVPKRQNYPGAVYHVISRGVRRSPIFLSTNDYLQFFRILNNTMEYAPFKLHAYCLMTNHYHLLISTQMDPLNKVMHCINGSYATWFNKKYKLSGHVFENRYASHPVPSDYKIMTVSAYIHNNPLAANITDDPIKYPWSSYYHYATPEIISKPVIRGGTSVQETLPKNLLFASRPNPSEWKNSSITYPPQPPPKCFTRDKIRQLFPIPLHIHYQNYVKREWKLSCIQDSTIN